MGGEPVGGLAPPRPAAVAVPEARASSGAPPAVDRLAARRPAGDAASPAATHVGGAHTHGPELGDASQDAAALLAPTAITAGPVTGGAGGQNGGRDEQ